MELKHISFCYKSSCPRFTYVYRIYQGQKTMLNDMKIQAAKSRMWNTLLVK